MDEARGTVCQATAAESESSPLHSALPRGNALHAATSDVQRALAVAARDIRLKGEAMGRAMQQILDSLNDSYTQLTHLAADLQTGGDSEEAAGRLRDAAEAQIGTTCDKAMELLFVRLLWNMTETFDRLGHAVHAAGKDGVSKTQNATSTVPGGSVGFRELHPMASGWPIQPLIMMGMYHANGLIPTDLPTADSGRPLRFPPPPAARFAMVAPQADSSRDWNHVRRLMHEGAWVRFAGSSGLSAQSELGNGVDRVLTNLFCIPSHVHERACGSIAGSSSRAMKLPTGAFVVPLSHRLQQKPSKHSRLGRASTITDHESPSRLQQENPHGVEDKDTSQAVELALDDLLAAFEDGPAQPTSVPLPPPHERTCAEHGVPDEVTGTIMSRARVAASAEIAAAAGSSKVHRPERDVAGKPKALASVVADWPGAEVDMELEQSIEEGDMPVIASPEVAPSLPSQIVGYRHDTELNIRPKGSRKKRGQSSGRVAIGDVSYAEPSVIDQASSPIQRSSPSYSEFARRHEDVLFQISASVKSGNKQAAKEAIRQLGCRVNSEPHYDPAATHLLVAGDSIERTEKFLSFRAAGKLIVSASYVFDSLKQGDGRLLNEGPYREPSERILPPLPTLPFADWHVVLFALPHISRGIRTILLAGGCTPERVAVPPFHHHEEWTANEKRAQEWLESLPWAAVTHVLVEVQVAPPDAPADFSPLAAAHVPAAVAALDAVSMDASGHDLAAVLTGPQRRVMELAGPHRPQFFSLEHLFQILCVPPTEQALGRTGAIRYAELENICPPAAT